MRVLLFAGEASGDAYAEQLVHEFRKTGDDFEFEAVGGKRLAATGCRMIADSSSWGAVGIGESLKTGRRIVAGSVKFVQRLKTGKPGLFIPIDFGYANIKLARQAKKLGWKVLYFVPPGSWRKDRQGKDLPQITDAIVTPFEWSADLLNAAGANAHWFGHPLVEMVGELGSSQRTGVAVLPGSRLHEIANHLPAMIGAISRFPDEPVTIVRAPSIAEHRLRELWTQFGGDWNRVTVSGDRYQVLKNARAGIICSGTATLEAALCQCPMVVIYRVGTTAVLEAKILRVKFDFISLPNIFLNRMAVPELIQTDANSEKIAIELQGLLPEGRTRQIQIESFQELRSMLRSNEVFANTVNIGVSLLKSQSTSHSN